MGHMTLKAGKCNKAKLMSYFADKSDSQLKPEKG